MEAASLAFHPGPAVQREQGGKGPALLCLVNLVSLTDQGVKDRVQQGESSTMERKLKGKRQGGEAGVELSGRALCSHESSPGSIPVSMIILNLCFLFCRTCNFN